MGDLKDINQKTMLFQLRAKAKVSISHFRSIPDELYNLINLPALKLREINLINHINLSRNFLNLQ